MESIIKPNGKAKSWPLFVLIYVNDMPAHSCNIGKEFPVTIVLGRRKREIRKWSLWFQLSWSSNLALWRSLSSAHRTLLDSVDWVLETHSAAVMYGILPALRE